MPDRDSIYELFDIIKQSFKEIGLPMAEAAMDYYGAHLGMGCDIYYRRRLSVCRMLIDLYLPVPKNTLDTMLAATLINHMPGDLIPEDQDEVLGRIYADAASVWETLAILKHTDYSDKSYYDKIIRDPKALIIRLVERSVLLEKLYEWHPTDALRYVRETREFFFPLCLYAKENYPEYLGAASILHEKMRNLTTVNEALLTRFVEIENAISDEILALREENASIRAMIRELETAAEA